MSPASWLIRSFDPGKRTCLLSVISGITDVNLVLERVSLRSHLVKPKSHPMETYLKIHLCCALIALALRFSMAVVISKNRYNVLMMGYYTSMKVALEKYGIVFLLMNKKLYSGRHPYNIKLTWLPIFTVLGTFANTKAFLQAFFLGPLQIFLEGLALALAFSHNHNQYEAENNKDYELMEEELEYRLDAISMCKSEKELYDIVELFFIKDGNAVYPEEGLDAKSKRVISFFFKEHLAFKDDMSVAKSA